MLPSNRPRRRVPASLLLASVLILLAASVQGAAALTGSKPYTAIVTVSPDPVGAGATATYHLYLEDDQSNTQQIGSANISAPGITFPSQSISLSTGTATVYSDHIELRDLSIQPGGSISIDFDATVTCSPNGDTVNWDVEPHQSNNYNGPPGNAFYPPTAASDTETGVTGSCHLAFRVEDPAGTFTNTQPADAEKNATITTVIYDPTGARVKVEAEDGTGYRLTSFSGTITLASSPSAKLGGTYSTPAVDGVATFTPTIPTHGTYTFQASSTSIPSSGWATSNQFTIVDDACGPGETCTVNIPGKEKVESTNTGGGYTTISVGGTDVSCGDSYEHAPYVTEINNTDSNATGTKSDTVTIYKQYVNSQPNNGVSFYQVCYQANHSFTTLDGSAAVEDPAGTFTGLLPDCPPHPSASDAPCVLSKTKDKAGNVVIELLLPAGDPKHR